MKRWYFQLAAPAWVQSGVFAFMLWIGSTTSSYAVFTNLVTFGEFEGLQSSSSDPTRGPINPIQTSSEFGIYAHDTFNTQYPQWSTQANNDFQIQREGTRQANVTGADGNPTGNYLEVQGYVSSGVITLTITMPSNIIAGANNAMLQFEASSRVASTQTTGRYSITAGASSVVNNATITNTTGIWSANSIPFTVAANDTVVVSWRDTGSSATQGLRIDDIRLLADIAAVPEPGLIGALLVLSAMVAVTWRRRWRVSFRL